MRDQARKLHTALAYYALSGYTNNMTTTENLTSNNPMTVAFWDRIATDNRKADQDMPNPNGCAYCETSRCQHTDN